MSSLSKRASRWPFVIGGLVLALVVAIGICEALGWPFLVAPMQRWLTQALDRPVSFTSDAGSAVRIGLLGSIRAKADTIVIGAPSWSQAPHMLRVRGADLKLGYLDLWRASRGQPLTIDRLGAAAIDGTLERLADGRASWQFGIEPAEPATDKPRDLPRVGELRVGNGMLRYLDAVADVQLDARFTLSEGETAAAASTASAASGTAVAAAAASQPAGLRFEATGRYRKQPLRIDIATPRLLPLLGDDAAGLTIPIRLDATIGRARIEFDGTATDAVKLSQLRGRFKIDGPSLAAVGDPLGVTLPTTPPFRTNGTIVKEGLVWNAVFDTATVGSSRIAGAFTYDSGRKQPLLSGRLTGTRLLLADLGPAVGAPVPAAEPAPAARPGKVLPDRPFDLPALRAMNANVLIDIDHLDLGSKVLQPLRPLRTHLVLRDGVLRLGDIDARTGQGRLGGAVQLDGRSPQALWSTDLRWDGVRLESWIKQNRGDDAPPYISGRLNGRATVTGQGRSTAAILASLKGDVRMYLLNGSISHLAVEAAGLDLAQSLGVLIKGDDALAVQCTVADLVVDKGVLRPRVMVLDTSDTTLLIDGTVSLASEALDVRVIASPKDFSLFAPRTPVLVRGSLGDPAVSIEFGKLGARVGAAALLALVNPIAAVLPFMDAASGEDARDNATKCQALAQRRPASLPPGKR